MDSDLGVRDLASGRRGHIFSYNRRGKGSLIVDGWGFCGQADAFPHLLRSKLQCKRALCQKRERRQNCQCCREDKEGEGLQISFGMNNFIFVKERTHKVAGEWKGDGTSVWMQKWVWHRARRGDSLENSAGEVKKSDRATVRGMWAWGGIEVMITRWASWRWKVQERLVIWLAASYTRVGLTVPWVGKSTNRGVSSLIQQEIKRLSLFVWERKESFFLFFLWG